MNGVKDLRVCVIVGVSSVFEFRVARTWKAGVVAGPLRFAGLVGATLCAAVLAGCATQQTIAGPRATSKALTSRASVSTGTVSARSNFTGSIPRTARSAGRNPAADVSSIPLPGPALLERQPAPDCDYRSTPSGNAGEDTRARLDYQQQCYRQAEGIVRTRLDTLQDSVGETIRAVKGR